MHKLRTLHLFSGAGGGILGDILLGHQPICAVEIEPYCQQVLHARQQDGLLPWFPIFADVKTFDGRPWRGIADIVCGGFPYQDISYAGKGAGINGERSGLWSEMYRVVCEVVPRFVFVENSPMLTSRGLGRVLGDMAKVGYDARWGVFSAGQLGARHERERIWLLAYSMREGLERRWENRSYEKMLSEKEFAIRGSLHGLSVFKGTESDFFGVVDGLANRSNRLKAIGNGQVPAVVKLAWEILSLT